jgi:hypothetical protein
MTTTFVRKNLQATRRFTDLTARTPSMRQDLGGTMERRNGIGIRTDG